MEDLLRDLIMEDLHYIEIQEVLEEVTVSLNYTEDPIPEVSTEIQEVILPIEMERIEIHEETSLTEVVLIEIQDITTDLL